MDVQQRCVELENVMMIHLEAAPVSGSMRGGKKQTPHNIIGIIHNFSLWFY